LAGFLCKIITFSLDLSNFFCICVDATLLQSHFDDLLHIYYNEFQHTLSCLGYTKPSFSIQDIYDDYSQYGKWGLVCAFEWLPLMLTNLERSVDLTKDLERTSRLNTSVLQKRLCSLIDFYQKRGYL